MTLPRFFVVATISLFIVIGLMGIFRKNKETIQEDQSLIEYVEEQMSPLAVQQEYATTEQQIALMPIHSHRDVPAADRMNSLFDPAANKLPFVKTVVYSSKVPWQQGRPAWIADYASHYHTSRHFIARSLNGSHDYYTQNVANGDRFNVLDPDKNLEFHLVIDLSRCQMWLYSYDKEANEHILLKNYSVGIGRLDGSKASGSLTPIGDYLLGDRIAIFRPGSLGYFNRQKTEMIQVFGTRWIPFEKEMGTCTAPAKGLGIHGAPWKFDNQQNAWVEDTSGIGGYLSDGCVRLKQADMEEIFAIVVTRPTIVHLVNDFFDIKLPGVEKQ